MREIVATGSEASLRHLGDAGSFETSSAPPDDRRDVPYVPDRSRTAPAASSRPSAPTTQAPLLRRAHTTSARIDVLQQVYAAVQADGSQMPVDEMLAATKLVHDIGGVLNERLLKRLGDGGNDGRHLG
ncbi:hypothetical protein B0H21DRAFT_726359 [Amylocystis lapponica]|nr:hypothetical protein B0H21DRAFT_726359 [Amylocystis lapponica]